jgi:XRE family transcriptional regulator, regulator of sulfur utilization
VRQYKRREIARAFGAALRAARQEQGMSQDVLSEICDFDRTYPSLLERGLRGPTVAMLLRLADALDVEPSRLINETVERLRKEVQS